MKAPTRANQISHDRILSTIVSPTADGLLCLYMPGRTILWLISAALAVGVVAVVAFLRRHGSNDLGSVSAAWTTEHNIGDRGGDRSNG
jgi:hypothetical protein